MLTRLQKLKRLVVALMLVCVAACSTQPLTRPPIAAMKQLRTVALVEIAEPDRYIVYNYISPLTALGTVGHLIKEADLDLQGERFNKALGNHSPRIGKRLTDRLANYFEQMGYTVIRLPDTRVPGPDGKPLLDPKQVKVTADAIVDVQILRAGYVSTIGVNPYAPVLSVSYTVYERPGNSAIALGSVAYGVKPFWGESAFVPASDSYRFGSFGKIIDNAPRAVEGLHAGLQLIATQITSEFGWVNTKPQ